MDGRTSIAAFTRVRRCRARTAPWKPWMDARPADQVSGLCHSADPSNIGQQSEGQTIHSGGGGGEHTTVLEIQERDERYGDDLMAASVQMLVARKGLSQQPRQCVSMTMENPLI